MNKKLLFTGIAIITAVLLFSTRANAQVSENMVQNYAAQMQSAAKSKDINKIAAFISDDALISIQKDGTNASLDKAGYLALLKQSFGQPNHRFEMDIDDIVVFDGGARAQVLTRESWGGGGLDTKARATFSQQGNKAVITRLIIQATAR